MSFAWLKNIKFLSRTRVLRLRYAENSIKIEFGSIEESASGIRYSCRLNGGKWSSPSASGIKEYTNLKEGDYFFEVKAIGVDGRESVDSIRFSVSPSLVALNMGNCLLSCVVGFYGMGNSAS